MFGRCHRSRAFLLPRLIFFLFYFSTTTLTCAFILIMHTGAGCFDDFFHSCPCGRCLLIALQLYSLLIFTPLFRVFSCFWHALLLFGHRREHRRRSLTRSRRQHVLAVLHPPFLIAPLPPTHAIIALSYAAGQLLFGLK